MPGTTAREITGRASANLASIPYYFGTKDALVAEALIADARDLVAPVMELLGSDVPAVDRASEAVTVLNDLFAQSRDQVPGYLSALASAPHVPAVQAGLAELWADLRLSLSDDIAAQQVAGHLPAWVVPDAMASLIIDLVNGVVVASVTDPDGPTHHEVAGQFLMLLLAARTPSGEGTSR